MVADIKTRPGFMLHADKSHLKNEPSEKEFSILKIMVVFLYIEVILIQKHFNHSESVISSPDVCEICILTLIENIKCYKALLLFNKAFAPADW